MLEKTKAYTGYKGLPPFAGLLSVKEALEKGLTAAESVAN